MLNLALKARLPLIAVQTDDELNVGAVLSAIAGKQIKQVSEMALTSLKVGFKSGSIAYTIRPQKIDYTRLYGSLGSDKATLVVVNPNPIHPIMFDGGPVYMPEKMLKEFLIPHVEPSYIEGLVSAFSGLSLKEVVEIIRLAETAFHELTPRSVANIRRQYFGGVRGLQQVDTNYLYYDPPQELQDWLALDGQLFIGSPAGPLTPRGLLFDGGPGLGKTAAAKYVATELQTPLYRIDMSMIMSRYVGDSESNLVAALKQAEASAPCIVLLDEVEKLFTQNEDSGVTTRILSHLLWWLQEHKARVLTLMTTNNKDAIPPELYRPGRIDAVMEFHPLDEKQAIQFVQALGDVYEDYATLEDPELAHLIHDLYQDTETISQAQLTESVLKLVKKKYLSGP